MAVRRVLDGLLKGPRELGTRLLTREEKPFPHRRVRIATDSASDLPPQLAEDLGIAVVPCKVIFGQEVFRDNIDITREELYQRMTARSEVPTTSQPSVEEFREFYEEAGRGAEGIVAIHLSAKLSGTFNSARLAAQELPKMNIAVVDSQNCTMAQGLLAIQAARAANEGKSLAEIITLVEEAIPRVRLLAILDTLKFIQLSGRIGKAAALLGTILNLKPIIQVSYGEVLPLEKVRTKPRAMRRLVELVQAAGPVEEMSALHTHTPEGLQQLVELLEEIFPTERIITGEAGSVVGAHAGPGAVGAAFLVARKGEDTGREA